MIPKIFDRDVEKKPLADPNDIALGGVQNVRKECNTFGLLADFSDVRLLG